MARTTRSYQKNDQTTPKRTPERTPEPKTPKRAAVARQAAQPKAAPKTPPAPDGPVPGGGHIKFNGTAAKPTELYFRIVASSPALIKAPVASPIDADGYRTEGMQVICTGKDAVTEQLKAATGRTPGRFGIKFPAAPVISGGAYTSTSTSGGKKKREGLSILDAAVEVLKEMPEPASCTEIVRVMLEKKIWATKGKTPQATLYSAILRDLQQHGTASRFTKADRGRFTLTK